MLKRHREKIIKKGKKPIIVGGTGLYLDSLIYEIDYQEIKFDEKYRIELENEVEKNGLEKIYEKAKSIDPKAIEKISPNDKKRILRILEIGQGDEVIVPAYTYTASASVINHVGAKIVFIDCGKDSFGMDYNNLEKLITEKTKAIIAVDIAGIPADYSKIYEIVEKNKEISLKLLFSLSLIIFKDNILPIDLIHDIGQYIISL